MNKPEKKVLSLTRMLGRMYFYDIHEDSQDGEPNYYLQVVYKHHMIFNGRGHSHEELIEKLRQVEGVVIPQENYLEDFYPTTGLEKVMADDLYTALTQLKQLTDVLERHVSGDNRLPEGLTYQALTEIRDDVLKKLKYIEGDDDDDASHDL